MDELPVIQDNAGLPERADAARNREKVLAAAERLFAQHGPDCVSMDAVAAAAGVGKGTLFRRFGDRAGLAGALLDEHERRLQEDVIRGPAPLGPGAPPGDRLIAFGVRMLEHFGQHGALITAAEANGVIRGGPHAFYLMHLRVLVRDIAPEADAEYVAEALLAPLSARHVLYLQRVRDMSTERIAAGWADLVRRLLSYR
jgi:AcrR family transcriptional regulator